MPPGTGDLLLKQLVARIDRRTTVICLHAAGQIQPVTEPFETIAGDYDRPPFHAHCRSIVTPYMAGFVNRYRKEANAELVTRSSKEKRMADGRIPNRIPKPPDPLQGGPTTFSPLTPRGPQPLQIPSQDVMDQVRKGDVDLEDLVETHNVKYVIDNAPERFVSTANGGGISESFWVEDTATGRRYVLKRGNQDASSLVEVVATELEERLGLKYGRTWFAEDVGTNVWTLTQHVEDVLPGSRVIDIGLPPVPASKIGRKVLSDPSEVVRTTLHDFVTDQTDRHKRNWLRLELPDGKQTWMPIDQDASFLGFRGFAPSVSSMEKRLSLDTLEKYTSSKTNGPPMAFVRTARTLPDADVVKAYDDFVDTARRVDPADVTRSYRGLSDEIDTRLDEIDEMYRRRVDDLIENREENLRYLGVEGEIPEIRRVTTSPSTVDEVITGAIGDSQPGALLHAERKFDPMWQAVDGSDREMMVDMREAIEDGRVRLPILQDDFMASPTLAPQQSLFRPEFYARMDELRDDVRAGVDDLTFRLDYSVTHRENGIFMGTSRHVFEAPLSRAQREYLAEAVDDQAEFYRRYMGVAGEVVDEPNAFGTVVSFQKQRWELSLQDVQQRLLGDEWRKYDDALALKSAKRPPGSVMEITGDGGQRTKRTGAVGKTMQIVDRNLVGETADAFRAEPVHVVVKSGAGTSTAHIDEGVVFYKGTADPSIVVHETGHMVQNRMPLNRQYELMDWVRERIEGTDLRRLNELTDLPYGDHAVAWDDKFVSPYTGRLDYGETLPDGTVVDSLLDPNTRATEFVAIGTQNMLSSGYVGIEGTIQLGGLANDFQHALMTLYSLGWDLKVLT